MTHRRHVSLLALCLTAFAAMSQPIIRPKSDNDSKTTTRPVWECGRTRGVVDCNADLMMEPARGLVVDAKTGEPYSGTCETCHRNGKRERIVNFKNGKDDGVDTTWFDNGKVQVVRSHIEGYADGIWQYYYYTEKDAPDRMAWEIQYSVDQKTGKHMYFYDKEGSPLRKVENYANDLLNGMRTEYYEDGVTPRKEVEYKDGVQHGAYNTYYENGNKESESTYENGVLVGEVKVYYKDGNLYSVENYGKDGERDGVFLTYTEEGDTVLMKTFKNGFKDGYFLVKRENGMMAWEAEYERCRKCVPDTTMVKKKDTVVAKVTMLDGSRTVYQYHYDEFGERIEVIDDEEEDDSPKGEGKESSEAVNEKKRKGDSGKKER